jgi:hypothetical protein
MKIIKIMCIIIVGILLIGQKSSQKIYLKNQPKRPSHNGWVQINLSKMAFWNLNMVTIGVFSGLFFW